MSRTALAAVALAAFGVLVSPAAPSSPAAPQLHCKYGSKVVVKLVHGHKKHVRVCKKKPPPPKPKADLELELSATLDTVTAGNHVAYTALVENSGKAYAEDTKITIDLPAGKADVYSYGTSEPASCNDEESGTSRHVVCDIGELAPEATAEEAGQLPYAFLHVVLEPDEAGQFTASAEVESSTPEANPDNDSMTKSLHVLPGPPSADLSVSLTSSPDPVSVPDGYTETVSVTNTGPSEATDVYITVLLPQGASVAPPSIFDPLTTLVPTGICPPYVYSFLNTTVACFDSVGSGQTQTQTFDIAPSIRSPGTLKTDAVVSSYTRDPNLANNRASADTTVSPFQPPAGVSVSLTFDPLPDLVAGKPLVIPFRLSNLGLADAEEASVEGSISPEVAGLELDLAGADSAIGCFSTDQPIDCHLDDGLPSDTRYRGFLSAPSVSAGTYTATVTLRSPDLPYTVTVSEPFEVKPSPARR